MQRRTLAVYDRLLGTALKALSMQWCRNTISGGKLRDNLDLGPISPISNGASSAAGRFSGTAGRGIQLSNNRRRLQHTSSNESRA